jgi:phosphosulfolactate synthase
VKNLAIFIPSLNLTSRGRLHVDDYLKLIGVPKTPPLTSQFDPGYDLLTLAGHLEQSHHLMSILKVSMACWMIANEDVTRQKIAVAKKYRVPTTTGGGPFEVAYVQGKLK